MLTWIAAHLGTIIVLALLLAAVAAVIAVLVRDRKKGKSSCGCSCAHCALSGVCHKGKGAKEKGRNALIKTTLQVEGMACSMCESHVSDALRRSAEVKKVKADHRKGTVELLSENPLEEAALYDALVTTGYRLLSVHSRPHEKKGWFGK